MTEDGLLEVVRRLCYRHDVWWYHPAAAPVAPRFRGFPDLVLVGPEGGLFRELKSETGRVTIEQWSVGALMRGAGWNWAIWRPADLASGRIETEIATIGGREPWEHRWAA
jgi:hypothetical protein